MGVNWSKDINQTLATVKESFTPSCWLSARLQREETVLGWMPGLCQARFVVLTPYVAGC
jgi:hypothetical protein